MALPNSPYNLTDLYDSTRVVDLFTFSNTVTDGLLIGIFLVAVFFIMMLSLRRYDFNNTLLVSSFVCFILSVFFGYAGLLNFLFIIGFLVILAFSGFYAFVTRE